MGWVRANTTPYLTKLPGVPFTYLNAANYTENGGAHSYHGAVVKAERRFKGGLYYQAHLTMAKSVADDWSTSTEDAYDTVYQLGTVEGMVVGQSSGANLFGGDAPKWVPPFAWGIRGDVRLTEEGFLTTAGRVLPRGQPFVVPLRGNDHRHPVVHPGEFRRGRGRDDAARLERLAALINAATAQVFAVDDGLLEDRLPLALLLVDGHHGHVDRREAWRQHQPVVVGVGHDERADQRAHDAAFAAEEAGAADDDDGDIALLCGGHGFSNSGGGKPHQIAALLKTNFYALLV